MKTRTMFSHIRKAQACRMKPDRPGVATTVLLLGFLALLGSCAVLPGIGPGQGTASSPGRLSTLRIPGGPRMFWTVSGGPNGRGTLYVQGTLHLGRDELFPLDKKVLDLMASSDVILAQLSPGDLARSRELVLDRMAEAVLEGGKTLEDLIPAADAAIAAELMGRENFRRLAIFRPWVAYSAFELFIAGKLALDPEKGVDAALYSLAARSGKVVHGLEDPEFPLDVLTGPALNIQVLLLRNAIREYKDHPEALKRMYEAYRDGSHRNLANELEASLKRSLAFAPELSAFNDALLKKRNTEWVKVFDSYLRKGKSVFVFVEAAHMFGPGNLLERLSGMGYKIEP